MFAAASLTDAIDEVSLVFEAASGHSVTPVYASSSALARQIESGAPAHIFISASIAWMDYLEERELIDPLSRLDLLANSLVIIAPTGTEIEIDNLSDLPELLGEGNRLSIGDPEHVPAGIYAAEALEGLGLWDELAGRTARMGTVRSALAIVERGETPLGIVYATDAAITENVEVVAAMPEESHQPIVYPAPVIGDLEDGD
ncbi:MAG: molybdate ABC transporter substrate-binding protein, partial [Pseudomonadota bacterium]